MSNKDYVKRLAYTKYIYEHGIEFLTKKTSISNAMAILNFHDASEQFLLIIADKLGFKPPFNYLDYWTEAKKKKKSLPNKNDMSKLNKMRVSFKHHGILPTFEDCKDIQYKLHDFFITVSKDILDLDFLKLSLADLIEYEEVKKHLKNAEKYLEQGNYEESIVESAKAFKLFEIKTEGDIWHSHILKENPFGFLNKLVNYGKIEDKLLLESLREIRDRLREIIPNLNLFLLGIDTYKFHKFNLLTPIINLTLGGKFYVHKAGSPFKHILNYNEENALFCINFVKEIALKFQSETFGLINRNKPQTIKIKNEGTEVYSYKGGAFKKIGIVGKDKIFDNAKLTLLLEKGEDYWGVDYEGSEGYIKTNDADWIRET